MQYEIDLVSVEKALSPYPRAYAQLEYPAVFHDSSETILRIKGLLESRSYQELDKEVDDILENGLGDIEFSKSDFLQGWLLYFKGCGKQQRDDLSAIEDLFHAMCDVITSIKLEGAIDGAGLIRNLAAEIWASLLHYEAKIWVDMEFFPEDVESLLSSSQNTVTAPSPDQYAQLIGLVTTIGQLWAAKREAETTDKIASLHLDTVPPEAPPTGSEAVDSTSSLILAHLTAAKAEDLPDHLKVVPDYSFALATSDTSSKNRQE